MSLTLLPDRYSAPPVLTCTMPSDCASAKPRSVAVSVCELVTLMAGQAEGPALAARRRLGEAAQRGVQRLRAGHVDGGVGEAAGLGAVQHLGVDLGGRDGHSGPYTDAGRITSGGPHEFARTAGPVR